MSARPAASPEHDSKKQKTAVQSESLPTIIAPQTITMTITMDPR